MKKLLVFLVLIACVAAVAFASLRNEVKTEKKEIKTEKQQKEIKKETKKKHCYYS